ncbi:MAG: cation-translocating P-type ATPase [Bacillota bacterium]
MAEDVVVSRYRVAGLTCADCAETVRRAVSAVEGVDEVEVSFATGLMRVAHHRPVDAEVVAAVRRAGYRAERVDGAGAAAEHGGEAWWRGSRAPATLLSGLLAAGGFLASTLEAGQPWAVTAWAAAIVVGGLRPARGAWTALRQRHIDMNVLMTLAVVGAAAIGEWSEGAAVVFLYSLGELLEEAAVAGTRRSIRHLMNLTPPEAEVLRDGRVVPVPVAEVRVGERVLVRPGGRVPVDGRIAAGRAALNEAPITGEAAAVDKGPGDEVFAGTVSENGYLEVDALRVAGDTTLSRIIHMVEEAQQRRARVQRWIDDFARRYTPAVVAAAALVAVVPPLCGAPWEPWLYRGLALLILACPCALVISTPVAVVSAIGRAARWGVLIKGGAHLEALSRVRVVALDKTGTLTLGRPQVTDAVPLDDVARLDGAAPGAPTDRLLALAAAAQMPSEHPLGRAVVAAARARGLEPAPPESFEVYPGQGVRARVQGMDVVVGTLAFAAAQAGLDPSAAAAPASALEAGGKTVVAVARLASPGRPACWLGLIALADEIRPGAAALISRLRAAGVRRIVMLTGDAEPAARRVAAAVGIDEVRCRLLPEGKMRAIEALEAEEGGGVLYVGDGINDAPALARASVGVAMGAAGTAAAVETAGVVLMGDDLDRLPRALDLARRALGVIRQNVAFSLAVKAAALVLLAAGRLSLWLAIAADTGATLVVVANGLRLLRAPAGHERRAPEPAADTTAPSRTTA